MLNIDFLINQPVPSWTATIKPEVRIQVEASPIMVGCSQGKHPYLNMLMMGYWPFVDVFPNILNRA